MQSLLTLFGLVETAYASPYYGYYCSALGTYCGDGQLFIIHLADRTAAVLVVPVVGGIAVAAVIWAAIKMISSGGDDSGKEDAKKIILGAVIGIVLAVTGSAVVHWVCLVVEAATNAPGGGLCG
jgi:hypothetical protein